MGVKHVENLTNIEKKIIEFLVSLIYIIINNYYSDRLSGYKTNKIYLIIKNCMIKTKISLSSNSFKVSI